MGKGYRMRLDVLTMAAILGGCSVAALASQPVEERLAALGSPDPAERVQASHELAAAGAPAVAELLQVMDGDAPTARKMAYDSLFRMVQQAAGTDRQGAVAAALVDGLRAGHSVETRRKIYRLLSFVGNDDSLVELYKGLSDPQVRDMARFAISRIPGRAATMALVAALQIAEPPFLLGLMQAIGERGDVRAVPAMVGAIRDPNPAIRQAGFEVLAALPDPLSLTTIRQALQDNISGALDALLALGLNAGERGRPELAREVWRVASKAELTDAQSCRLLHLLAYLNPEERDTAVRARLTALTTRQGPRQMGCLMDALANLPGRDATMVFVEIVEQRVAAAEGEARADVDQEGVTAELVEVLGRRGDPAALPALEKLKTADDARVRAAAERASARLKSALEPTSAPATNPGG